MYLILKTFIPKDYSESSLVMLRATLWLHNETQFLEAIVTFNTQYFINIIV